MFALLVIRYAPLFDFILMLREIANLTIVYFVVRNQKLHHPQVCTIIGVCVRPKAVSEQLAKTLITREPHGIF